MSQHPCLERGRPLFGLRGSQHCRYRQHEPSCGPGRGIDSIYFCLGGSGSKSHLDMDFVVSRGQGGGDEALDLCSVIENNDTLDGLLTAVDVYNICHFLKKMDDFLFYQEVKREKRREKINCQAAIK